MHNCGHIDAEILAAGTSSVASMAIVEDLGTSSRNNPNRFCPSGELKSVIPVALPPG